jgi:hypothetical protein
MALIFQIYVIWNKNFGTGAALRHSSRVPNHAAPALHTYVEYSGKDVLCMYIVQKILVEEKTNKIKNKFEVVFLEKVLFR